MTNIQDILPVYGVVPAAGLSRRMGTAKQVLPIGSRTMTGQVVQTMLDAQLDGVVVITRAELQASLGLPADNRIVILINNDAKTQMLDSIRLALDEIDGLSRTQMYGKKSGVLVIPGDIPGVSVAAVRECAGSFRKAPDHIVIATHQGKRAHPIVFPFAMKLAIENLKGGLNKLPHRYAERVLYVEIDDENILQDVDTRQDYERILRWNVTCTRSVAHQRERSARRGVPGPSNNND
jgi:molybdenum cofactor cytidylyltransferase